MSAPSSQVRCTQTSTRLPSVLVLGGGPDAERLVSLESAAAVADGLREAGATVHIHTLEGVPTLDELAKLPGEVVFPVLHGPFGEGGPMQALLEKLGRPFVGSRAAAARWAMDKLATKLEAARLGIDTLPARVFQPDDATAPMDLPVIIKPVCEGSSVGLHVCEDAQAWEAAHRAVCGAMQRHPTRVSMVEPLLRGRELTAGVLEQPHGGFLALPLVEILPRSGVYDYQAKYDRDDTSYVVRPTLPDTVVRTCQEAALALVESMGIRHVARVDFLYGSFQNTPERLWFMEVNTMPGFTSHSLLPMAGQAAGLDMAHLCGQLAELAWRSVAV